MKDWQINLYYRSRDKASQVQMVVAVLLLGLIAATAIHFIRPVNDPFGLDLTWKDLESPQFNWVDIVHRKLEKPNGMEALLNALEKAGQTIPTESRYELVKQIEISNLDSLEKRILSGVIVSLIRGCESGPEPDLSQLAQSELPGEAPPKYANYALAVFYSSCQLHGKAAQHFEAEGRLFGGKDARSRSLEHYLRAKDNEAVLRLAKDPKFLEGLSPRLMLRVAAEKRAWSEVLFWIIRQQLEKPSWVHLALSLLSGLFWLILLMQLGQLRAIKSTQMALALAAFALGACSTTLTLFVSLWQEAILQLSPPGTLVEDAFFFIMGVGFREETIKLLFFLPLAPILIKRGSQLEILTVAGCAGLGFAIEENLNYYLTGGGLAMVARFLTANFFHVASTALLGLAFCRIFIFKKTGLNSFTTSFWLIVLCHGLYDFLLSSPAVNEYALFAMTAYVGLCLFFFREAHHLRQPQRHLIPPLTVFLFGISVLLSAAMAELTYGLGLPGALMVLIPSTLEMAITAFIFIRELPEA